MHISDLKNIIEFEFDHVGIAVSSIDAPNIYDFMGVSLGGIEVVEREQVRVKMYELGNKSRIELLEPTNPTGVIARFLEKNGPGVHHICLRVKNIRNTLALLKERQVRLVHEVPFRGAHNCEVAFIHPASAGGVLIELSESVGEGRDAH